MTRAPCPAAPVRSTLPHTVRPRTMTSIFHLVMTSPPINQTTFILLTHRRNDDSPVTLLFPAIKSPSANPSYRRSLSFPTATSELIKIRLLSMKYALKNVVSSVI
ncbi:hypothetical protein ZOSMA_26G00430 [Zostera marina]|uniref:Uncharacterized protein n=1 Tax=Zostera marina TaxID=29655 RepID=A0A0K9PEA9_ZOSMR|nr:hypothetical protein ZOSMA_26G00430 [Zostera marina]